MLECSPGVVPAPSISYHIIITLPVISSLAPGHYVQGYIVNMHVCVQQKIGRGVQGHMGVRYYYYGNYVIYNKKSESRCGCSSLIFVTAVIRNFQFFDFSIFHRTLELVKNR